MPEKQINSVGGFLLVFLVLAYAGLLLIGPIVALVNSAFSEGLAPILESLIQPDAMKALWLTLSISFFMTYIVSYYFMS